MTKISLYSTVTPALDDKIIGTEVAGSPSNVTKNFTVGSIVDLLQLATLDESLVANSSDSSIRPATTDTLKQINFGVAQANPNVTIAGDGTITIVKEGWYVVNTAFCLETGTGTSDVLTLVALYKNGTIYGNADGRQTNQDSGINKVSTMEHTRLMYLEIGDSLIFYVVRDNDQANAGGLSYIRVSGGGPFPDVPAASLKMYKFN